MAGSKTASSLVLLLPLITIGTGRIQCGNTRMLCSYYRLLCGLVRLQLLWLGSSQQACRLRRPGAGAIGSRAEWSGQCEIRRRTRRQGQPFCSETSRRSESSNISPVVLDSKTISPIFKRQKFKSYLQSSGFHMQKKFLLYYHECDL